MEPQSILSWASFLGLWETEFRNHLIHAQFNDVCGKCFIFRNKYTFLLKSKVENTGKSSKHESEVTGNNNEEVWGDDKELPPNVEDIVKKVMKNVSQAQAQ